MNRFRPTAAGPSSAMGDPALSRVPSEAYWRSLALFNVFRQLVVIGLAASLLFFNNRSPSSVDTSFSIAVFILCGVYALLALLFTAGIVRRWPRFDIQLTIQVGVDVLFIGVLMYLSGGTRSGLGMLLLPYLAAAGLIAHGRMTLFHAALATMVLLGEESWRLLMGLEADFSPAVLLCVASFAVAWLAHRLAQRAQESLQLAEQRGLDLANLGQLNQRILQDVSEGVLVVDDRDRVRQFNERLIQLTGKRPQIDELLVASLPALAQILVQWRAAPEAESALLEFPTERKNLRARFVRVSPGTTGNVLIYLEDLERLREEAQKLKLAALGRLTANLAHEIRNPLSAIAHATELLKEEPLASATGTARLIQIIGDNAVRLENLVKDVLALNRRDRQQQVAIALAQWLPDFLDECCRVKEIRQAPQCLCPAEAVVHFDPMHLNQVLWNLLNNGWRYCRQRPGSQEITVQSDETGHWRMEVWNDGPPIPDETLRHLFEPFFTTEVRGTGLGLYIAREICQANFAEIEYVIPPRGGVSFCITFGLNDGEKKR